MKRISAIVLLVVFMLFLPASAAAYNIFTPTVTDNNGSVIVIGDSHTWLAGAGSQYPLWDTNCLSGRNSTSGVAVLEESLRPRHKIVVFDLATNDSRDPQAFRSNLYKVWRMIGPKRSLVLVNSWSNAGPEMQQGIKVINSYIRGFVSNHPGRSTQVKFGTYASKHPEVILSDNVHYTPEGYQLRTEMIENGVQLLEKKRQKPNKQRVALVSNWR